MAKWRDLIKEDFSHSFRRYGGPEAMATLIGILVSLVIAAISIFGIKIVSDWDTGELIGLGLFIWFITLILFVTPWRMLKARADELEKLKTPKIGVLHHHIHNIYDKDGRKQLLLSLHVQNLSSEPIHEVYGQIRNCDLLVLTPVKKRYSEVRGKKWEYLPPNCHHLPWSPDGDILYTHIAGNGSEFLYVAMTPEHSKLLFIATKDGFDYKQIGSGHYEFEIEIGSVEESFRQTIIRLEVETHGGHFNIMDCTDITESVFHT